MTVLEGGACPQYAYSRQKVTGGETLRSENTSERRMHFFVLASAPPTDASSTVPFLFFSNVSLDFFARDARAGSNV